MNQYLIIGQGSMGKRRVRCLLANKVPSENITVFDKRPDRLADACDTYAVNAINDYESMLGESVLKAVFVCVPGALHMRYCLAAARAGKHWFCEVPLSTGMEGLAELKSLTDGSRLIGAPGCQRLFHPLNIAIKEWASGSCAPPLLTGSYRFGSYLPDWHPYEDYRTFYASNSSAGGGNLDVIAQEMIWLRWVIGSPIHAVSCRSSKISSLELAGGTPDHQEIIVEFKSGLMLSMHFDILDRAHDNQVHLVAANSTLKWSNTDPAVHIYDTMEKKWERLPEPEGLNAEMCYHLEIGHFLKCIATGDPWPVSLDQAEEIIRFLHALELSNQTGRPIPLEEVGSCA